MKRACEKTRTSRGRSNMTHALKIVSPHFEKVRDGVKDFEVRFDDRDYLVGDLLILQEHYYKAPGGKLAPTGEQVERKIKHILRKVKGLMSGYIVLGLEGK